MAKIEVGDLVRLRSGGVFMTVEEVAPALHTSGGITISCVWFVGDEMMRAQFPSWALAERGTAIGRLSA